LSLAIFHSFLKTLKNKSNQAKEFSSERKNESTIFVFVVSISRLIFFGTSSAAVWQENF